MNEIEIEVNVTDAQGAQKKYQSKVVPVDRVGGIATVEIPGVISVNVETTSFDDFSEWGGTGYWAYAIVRARPVLWPKVKEWSVRSEYHTKTTQGNNVLDDRDVVEEADSKFGPAELKLSIEIVDSFMPSDTYGDAISKTSNHKIIARITLESWTYLPVHQQSAGLVLYRSSGNNLILRDGDG